MLLGACGDNPNAGLKDPHQEPIDRVAKLTSSPFEAALRERVETLFGQAQGKTWLPLDGWSVMRGELKIFLEWNPPNRPLSEEAERTLGVIESYDAMLTERGVELVLVPIPGRIEVAPNELGEVELPQDFDGANLGFARYLARLREMDIRVVDLLPIFLTPDESAEDPLYHRYNRHWTPRAVLLAAEKIAEHIRSIPSIEPGTLELGHDFEVVPERISYQLPPLIEEARDPIPITVHRVGRPDGGPLHIKAGTSPILFLGDSFGSFYSAERSGIVDHLFARLGRPIDPITIRGGGASEVWKTLKRRDAPLEGKRVLIWLFTAQYLVQSSLTEVQLFED